jgi:hypothetical protein
MLSLFNSPFICEPGLSFFNIKWVVQIKLQLLNRECLNFPHRQLFPMPTILLLTPHPGLHPPRLNLFHPLSHLSLTSHGIQQLKTPRDLTFKAKKPPPKTSECLTNWSVPYQSLLPAALHSESSKMSTQWASA